MKLAVTILVFCVASLLALGMVMLYSSSMAQVGARYLTKQLIWCAAWHGGLRGGNGGGLPSTQEDLVGAVVRWGC